uniref:Mediator of RNA polymerase II transcription subunit 15 n=1 Tax=Lygus hesperus TaxID=30085 RepID=A0A0A9Z2G0_LYGHE
MATEEWRTHQFRQSVVQKIDEAIQRSGMATVKKGSEMETHVYQKAKTKEEYLSFVARLILHVRELNTKKGGMMSGNTGPNMQDPINALQNLARSGSGNQMMTGGLQPPPQQQSPMIQAINPRPVLTPKLQPPVQGGQLMMGVGMGGPQMVGQPIGAQMAGPPQGLPPQGMSHGVGAGSPLSAAMGGGVMGPRKPDGTLAAGPGGGFVGPRAVAPGQYLRQSPTPPTASPVQPMQQPGSGMVPSPANHLVPSPNNPPMVNPASIRNIGMAPSPSSGCLNTPGQPNASPHSLQEDAAYREKIKQLSKYIEPLRKMISRVGSEGPSNVDKMSKMKTLLDILTNPNKRMPLETLLKCEVVLEKVDLKGRGEPVREQHPLIEALKNHLQSPVLNHSLQRTFGPCIEALFGSDIRNVPPPLKRKKIEEPLDDIPEVLQGEIARLDQRFKVSLDPSGGGGGTVQLICWLDDKHLPCVPPVSVSVPEDYPATPPKCYLATHEHSATSFLNTVETALASRISKLPAKFTVSQLLDTWEMAVRQACAPPPEAPVPVAPVSVPPTVSQPIVAAVPSSTA